MKIRIPGSDSKVASTVLLIFWFAVTLGLVITLTFFKPTSTAGKDSYLLALLPLIPLLISGIICRVVLPKADTMAKALPAFIIGIAMAGAGGFLGIFLGLPIWGAGALMGLFQFTPFWTKGMK